MNVLFPKKDLLSYSPHKNLNNIIMEEIEYLMIRGMDEEQAISTIVRGFLKVDIPGLPQDLKETINQTIQESGESMF